MRKIQEKLKIIDRHSEEIKSLQLKFEQLQKNAYENTHEIEEIKRQIEELKQEIIHEFKQKFDETQKITIENQTVIKNSFKFFTILISTILLVVNVIANFEKIKGLF